MVAGRPWSGLLFMVLIPVSLSRMPHGNSGLPLALWLGSAIWAARCAARRRRQARAEATSPLADPTVIHRQES